MKKVKIITIGLFCIILAVTVFMSACKTTPTTTPPSTTPPSTTPPTTAAPIVFRMSDSGTADNTSNPNYIIASSIFAQLDQLYPGKYKLDYYPSSSLYNDTDAQTAVLSGDLDMARSHCGLMSNLGGGIGPNFILGLLPVWKSFDDCNKAWLTYAPAMSKDLLEPKGAMFLGGASTWGAGLILKKDTKSAADLKGLKLHNPGGPFEASMMAAMGMIPVSMAMSEVPTALQTGAIDGDWTSIRSIIMGKVYKLAPYIPPKQITGVSGQSFILMNLKSWAKFPPDVQAKLMSTIIPAAEQPAIAVMKDFADNGIQEAVADGAIASVWSDQAIADYYVLITPTVNGYAAKVDLKYRQMAAPYTTIDLLAAK